MNWWMYWCSVVVQIQTSYATYLEYGTTPPMRPSVEEEERLVAELGQDIDNWNKLEMGDF